MSPASSESIEIVPLDSVPRLASKPLLRDISPLCASPTPLNRRDYAGVVAPIAVVVDLKNWIFPEMP